MKAFICFCFTLSSLFSNAQSFYDNFDDNSQGWILNSSEHYIPSIEDGFYKLVHKGDKYYWSGVKLQTDKKKDLKIEVKLSFFKFKKGNAGISFGGNTETDKVFFFMISPDGTFTYGQWTPKYFSFTGAIKSTAIKRELGAENKVRVEKVGGKIKFYINETEVHSASAKKFYGPILGLVGGGGNFTVGFDYLNISQTE